MENTDEWKQKYFNSLDKLEKLQQKTKSWEELENLLRLATNRVALAAEGVDPVLDKHLASLRKSVRSNEYLGLEAIIEDISSTVKRIDEQRQSSQRQLNNPPQLLGNLLDRLQFPKQYKKRVNVLRKAIQNLNEEQTLDIVLRDLAEIVNDTLNPNEFCQEATHDKGIFGRLFGRDSDSNHTPSQDKSNASGLKELALALKSLALRAAPAERYNGLKQQIDSSGDLASLTQCLAQLVAELPANKQTPEKSLVQLSPDPQIPSGAIGGNRHHEIQWGESEQQVIASFCLRLLEALDFPEELQPQAQALRETITEGFNIVATGSVIQKIADLITATRVRVEKEKQELQDFLHHLTEHLQDIDHQLSGAEDKRRANLEHNQQFDAVVQEHVNHLENSVNDASELGQLKQDIQQRLLTIREHFEKHRKSEEQQQQELQQALAASNSRLCSLEQESQQLRQRLTQEHLQAIHDALTGVYNRLAYEERIELEFSRWKRYQQPLVMLIFDIDHFKKINDTYGHKAGDKALKLIAKTLQNNLRESDFLARYGGEEFVVLMPQTELAAALNAANKLREAVQASEFHYQQKHVNITISCGAAQFKDQDTIETAFQRADQALYKAKQNGRNRCESAAE